MQSYREFIRAQGYDFIPEDFDNRWHTARCAKTERKLWYIGTESSNGFVKFSFGECGDKQKKFNWSNRMDKMDEKEQREFDSYIKRIAKAKEKHQVELAETLQGVFAAWEKGRDGSEYSEYLVKKGFGRDVPHGTIARSDGIIKNILCVPMYDEFGFMWSIQQLFGTKKTFWAGSRVRGTYFKFDATTEMPTRFLIGEGFATCLAAWKATGFETYCAWDTGNLEYMVRTLISRGVHPSNIILLADWDGSTFTKTGKNPGMVAVQRLTGKYSVSFSFPPNIEEHFFEGWDFADAHKAGIEIALDVKSYADIAGYIYEPPKIARNAKEIAQKQLELGADVLKITQKPGEEVRKITESAIVALTPENFDKMVRSIEASKADAASGLGVALPDYMRLSVDMLPDVDPLTARNPRPLATLRNFETIMHHIGAVIRYNVIKKDEEWMLPGEETLIDDRKNVLFARIIDLCCRVCMPIGQVDKFLRYMAERNIYNPVQTWIESREWDGVSRLEEFYKSVTAKDETLKKILMKRWLVSAVAAAYRPNGIMAQGLLVFQGAQYIGKTKWFKSLVPEELDLIAEGKTLKPDDKDSVKQILCYWLVELGEIDATFRRSDLALLKSFITRGFDMFRAAYARKESQFPRRTVFFGSVNKKEFLLDETGNRRYWTIECDAINWDHKIDMQQVWAEVAALYHKGEQWWLSETEMQLLNASNENFEAIDPVKELLQNLNWADFEGNWESATEIHRRIMPNSTPRQGELNKISHFVKILNGGKARKSNGKRELWVPKVSGKGLDRPLDPVTVPY